MSELELCKVCEGNGVLKIPGGVSVCPRCRGTCYEPPAAAPLAGAARPDLQTLRDEIARYVKATVFPNAAKGWVCEDCPEDTSTRNGQALVHAAGCPVSLVQRL